jgi:hypothetical protein
MSTRWQAGQPPQAPEPRQRPADRFGDAAVNTQLAQRAGNTWFRESFRAQLSTVWDVVGKSLAEFRDEIETEHNAKLAAIKSEILQSVAEAVAAQLHNNARELAMLRSEIAKLKRNERDRT